MMKPSEYRYYFLSLLAHLLVLLGMVLVIRQQLTPPLGEQQVTAINSYVYKGQVTPFSGADQLQQQAAAVKNEKIELSKMGLQKQTVSAHDLLKTPAKQNRSASTLASSSHGAETENLLTLLHTAIQKKQHYPLSAMQMEREGRVGVKFTLLTDGEVEGLRMTKSSGTSSLDGAALKAVRDASPFSKIEKYVKMPQEFTIDIVFELN